MPPLNALRAFEATARHLSMKAAADELCVTPGAVSQLVRSLEATLGVALFRRVRRGVLLTPEGQAYLPPVRSAFRLIAEATRKLVAEEDAGQLSITTTPFFAATWLLPRLPAFQAKHPDIDLHLSTTTALVDVSRAGVDVAIRHGLGPYPGLQCDHLLAVEVVPVAAPALVERLGHPVRPADLARWPRLNDGERKAWDAWFAAMGVNDTGAARGTSFDDTELLRQAALAGHGVALLPALLVAPDLAEGRLVALAETALVQAFAYYLLMPPRALHRPKAAAFRTWILAEMAGAGAAGTAATTPPDASAPSAR